jgi:hypothetical protein
MTLHASGGLSLGNTTDPSANNLSVTGAVTAVNLTANGTINAVKSSVTYNDEAGQIRATNGANTNQKMLLGYDATYGSFIQSIEVGTGLKTLMLNASGGAVTVNTLTSYGSLNVGGKIGATGTSTYNDESGQITIRNSSDTNKKLILGYDATLNSGFIQAIRTGTGLVPLLLNASGGGVSIGTTTDAGSGNLLVNSKITANGTISPQQATTAAAPTYVKGAMYFDTTLNKLRIGGATGWETVTSV